MKKIFYILMTLCFLCGCSPVNIQNDGESNTEETTKAVDTQLGEEQSEFTKDDFILYAETQNGRMPVIWLGMIRDNAAENESLYRDYFQGMDAISYNTQNVYENGEPTGETVDYIGLISYSGSREYLETRKGIRTCGFYETAAKPNSTADEVISAYELDKANESFYIGDNSSDNYAIVLYFAVDENGNVSRIKSAVDRDVSKIEKVKNADYFIKFLITENQVTGIQMFRLKRN